MLDQSFSKENILKFISLGDLYKYNPGRGMQDFIRSLEAQLELVSSEDWFFDSIKSVKVGRKEQYMCSDIVEKLILRKLNKNIKKIYKTKQSDRSTIISQMMTLLAETVPMNIVKIDIKNFYESVDRNAILTKIERDGILSFNSRNLLNKLFEDKNLSEKEGVPRGVNISATLSEIFMRDFDKFAVQIDGVYYYARYVDDIILFVFENPGTVKEAILEKLSEIGLRLNEHKSNKIVCFKGKCKTNCKCKISNCVCGSDCKFTNISLDDCTFDYLGYSFCYENIIPPKKPKENREIKISIAEKKVKKYKTRIIKSFLDFLKNNDFMLLENRIKFLTGNFYIKGWQDSSRLKSGIYYNYPMISNNDSLVELTSFLRKTTNSKSGSLGKKLISALTNSQRRHLSKYCFAWGYENKILHKFSFAEIRDIKRCWING